MLTKNLLPNCLFDFSVISYNSVLVVDSIPLCDSGYEATRAYHQYFSSLSIQRWGYRAVLIQPFQIPTIYNTYYRLKHFLNSNEVVT